MAVSRTDEEILRTLEDSTVDATRRQAETLRSILRHSSAVRYLRRHDAPPVDPETFRSVVPLSTYVDYADCIDRMASDESDSDRPILSVDPLVCFFYSSGTSSMEPKLIPYFDSPLSRAASFLAHQSSGAVLRRLFPPRSPVNKILWFTYAGNVTYTKGGTKVMAASAFPFQNSRASSSQFLSTYVSPREVILGSDCEQQMYCHLLCGLRNFNLIDGIRAPYAEGLARAFYMLESKWEQLCEDIEHGFPNFEISDVAMRESVVVVLGGPQLDLSKRIRSVCEEKNWGGIVVKLWPNVRYVKCVATGTMMQYYQKLKYFAGEVPVLGGDYFASECCVGINLDITQPPETTQYVMLPTAAYFEFLPYDLEKSMFGEETVELSAVEVGNMYEVVATTHRGLYRYRLGDIVKIVGFYNTSPRMEFVMRAPKTHFELVTERDLMSASESFRGVLRNDMGAEIKEFTSFFDLESSPKQLKFFVEIEGEQISLQENMLQKLVVFRNCCSSLEDGLGCTYKVQNDRGELGPLSVSIVRPGTFGRLLQVAIQNGAPASQYKPPKIVRNRKIVDLMEGSALITVCLDSRDN